MSKTDLQSISVVHPKQFSSGTSQTPGSQRMAAICGELDVTSGMWGGTFLVEPGARTGIHHHGEQETIVYVLEGESYVEWGEHGEHNATVRAGDFLHVPAWLPHREINPSSDKPFRWVVIRSTSQPIVVNLPDDYWE
jgi:Predicted mannose-6-phosphate isomerase